MFFRPARKINIIPPTLQSDIRMIAGLNHAGSRSHLGGWAPNIPTIV
jgi:hypothetical protein